MRAWFIVATRASQPPRGSERSTLWQHATNVTQRLGIVIRRLDYFGCAAPLSQILADGANQYVYGGERLFGTDGSTRRWYDTDALGSVRQTLDDTGAVLGTVDYDPWGQVEYGTVPIFGFTGELQDGSDVYLRARWYNTTSGTFTSRDTFAGFPQRPDTLHSYAYAGNQPVLLTDPSGHCYPPVAFLRDIEPLNCSNLDQAIRIAQHPNASGGNRLAAGGYITAFVGSHAALLIGAGILTWEAMLGGSGVVTAISQWGSANIVAGTTAGQILTVGGTGASWAGTGYTLYQGLNGDTTAQAFLACPAAFGIANLWGDLANITRSGYQSARALSRVPPAKLLSSVGEYEADILAGPRNQRPASATVVYDARTGRVYRGRNAQPYPDGVAPWLQQRVELLPPGGIAKHGQPSLNCSECTAVNKALLDGARPEDLHIYTFTIRGGSAVPKIRCENCQITIPDNIIRIWSEILRK